MLAGCSAPSFLLDALALLGCFVQALPSSNSSTLDRILPAALLQARESSEGTNDGRRHTRETQQAFLEAQVGAFEFFEGVFDTARYDYLSAAVGNIRLTPRR